MFFLITGIDGTDENAMARRMEARPAHLKACELMKKDGQMLFGAALLDDDGKMIGSIIVVQVESRAAVDKYLATEPYVTGDVWRDINIQTIAVGSHFLPEPVKA